MESTEETRTITGFDDETTFQQVWEIRNFNLIYQDGELLNNQTVSFETMHYPNATCNWMVGFEKRTSHGYVDIIMYCQLIKMNGEIGPLVHVGFHPQMKTTQGDWQSLFNHSVKLRQNGRIETYNLRDIIHKTIQTNGSAFFNIQLRVLRQVGKEICQEISNQEVLKNLRLGSQTTLMDNLGKLLLDKSTYDVKIITSDDVELPGHRQILTVQNPVFASMLQSDFREGNTGVVKVSDINAQTMRIILRFLYTGQLLPEWSDTETVVEFMYAAGKYQLTEVLKMLDETLGNKSCEKYRSCYIPLLNLAGKLSLRKAERNLLKEISELTGKLKSAEEFFDLVVDKANAVLKADSNE